MRLPCRGAAGATRPAQRTLLSRATTSSLVSSRASRASKTDYLDVVQFHQSASRQPSTSRAHYEAEAIRMANDSHYGLAAYIWTHDIGSGLRAAHAIESGWIQVNQGLGQASGHSYGGYKQSGIGREFSLERILESFTQRKDHDS
jgi:hypothetical protein